MKKSLLVLTILALAGWAYAFPGSPIDGGGGSGTTNASDLSSGTLPAARIGDNSVTKAKLYTTGGTASATTYFRGDNTWATPAGSGTVTGPATATEDNVACWGADNVTLKDCGAPLSTYAPLVSPSFTTPTLGAASATTLDTGQGANELYDMNQNVQTTDNVTFNSVTAGEFISNAADNTRGVTVPNTADPTTTNLAAGKCWVTDNTWKCRTNDNTVTAIMGAMTKSYGFGIDNVAASDDVFIWMDLPRAITITKVTCFASVDNVVGSLTECTAADVTSCTAVDSTDFTIGGATLQTTATSFTTGFENAGIAAGAHLKWLTTSAPATSNKLSCTIQYRE